MSADQTITLSDGRVLGFAVYGDADGRPVIALHGTPGSRLKFADSDGEARALGLRIIAVDRWGYGLSSPKPEAALADFGGDMLALTEALKLPSCALLGVSGGGPYAVAAALTFGDRLDALALVAPVGPVAGRTQLSLMHRACFGLLPRLGFAIPAGFHVFRAGLLAAPQTAVRLAFSMAAPADRRALAKPGLRKSLADTFVAGLRPGVAGAVTDTMLFSRAWGITPEQISAPTKIWIGTADRNVPQAGVDSLAATIRQAEVDQLGGEGHLWIAENGAIVLKWLAANAGNCKQSHD